MVRVTTLTLAMLVLNGPVSADVLEPDKPSQIVHLRKSGLGTSCGPNTTMLDEQILPDGTITPFTIPSGRVLVLTGVSWEMLAAPHQTAIVTIVVSPSEGVEIRMFRAGVLADVNGSAAGSALIPKVVVKGPKLCYAASAQDQGVIVYGFLADDK